MNPRLEQACEAPTPAKTILCASLCAATRSIAGQDLECEVTSQFELQTVRGTFQSGSGALIVDDEEIAVGAVDVTQAHIDQGETRGGIQLNDR